MRARHSVGDGSMKSLALESDAPAPGESSVPGAAGHPQALTR